MKVNIVVKGIAQKTLLGARCSSLVVQSVVDYTEQQQRMYSELKLVDSVEHYARYVFNTGYKLQRRIPQPLLLCVVYQQTHCTTRLLHLATKQHLIGQCL